LALRRVVLDATTLTVARVFQVFASALSLPILSRFLEPSDFGLVAAANSILFLASVLADAGFANSLVRTGFDEKRIWSSVFWTSAAWSAGLALFLAVLSAPLSWLLREPRVAPLIAAMAVLPLGQGLIAAPTADLQQRRKFGQLGAADIFGSLAGIAAAIFVASLKAGPWALVAQSLIYLGVKASIVSASTRFRPSLVFDRSLISEHVHFARDTAAFGVVLFLATQMDNIVVARSSGPAALGVYSMAYRMMSMPSLLCSALNALYPRLVQIRSDKSAMRELVLVVTVLFSIIVFPPMAILCVSGESVFSVILSPRWREVAPIFSYMAPVGALQAVSGIHAPVLMAINRTDLRLRIAVEFTVLWMLVLISVAHFGIQAVAIGLLCSYLAYYPRFLMLFLRPLDCPIVDYIRPMAVPLCISAAVAIAHLALRGKFSFTPLNETFVAIAEILLAYCIVGLLLRNILSKAYSTSRALLGKTDKGA
jgi:PST family polysaccharide transporter